MAQVISWQCPCEKAMEADGDSDNIPASVARNIASIRRSRAERHANQSADDKFADAMSRFAGSMLFVYIHLAVFGSWIVANLGWVPAIPKWDPSLVVLAMVASVEAIFLSTFVLINQNQMTAEADERAELDLQISLLNERETTRLLVMTQAIANHLGIDTGLEPEIDELSQDTEPDVILDAVRKDTEGG
jgi:uncharacterized membrane protein